ncbi:MAG TPA: hypothetical protein VIX59_20890 [Candidatus Binataceae bacterium]
MEELARFAWRERLRITVWVERDDQHRPLSISAHWAGTMDDQTSTLLLELLTVIGLLMAWIAPKLSAGALALLFAMMAAVGFVLAIAGPNLGENGQRMVAALLTVPGVVLAVLGRTRLLRE